MPKTIDLDAYRRYRANVACWKYASSLYGDRYRRVTTHDIRVVAGALGEMADSTHCDIYAMVKGYTLDSVRRGRGPYNLFAARDFGAMTGHERHYICSHIDDLANVGLIAKTKVEKASKGHPISGLELAWSSDNPYETYAELDKAEHAAGAPEALVRHDTAAEMVELLSELVGVHDKRVEEAIVSGELGKALREVLGLGGEGDDSGHGHDGPPPNDEPPEPPQSGGGAPQAVAVEPEPPEPEPGPEAREMMPSGDQADDGNQGGGDEPLDNGLEALLEADIKATKVKGTGEYRRAAADAWRVCLEDGYGNDQILAEYDKYVDELRGKGKLELAMRLPKWLSPEAGSFGLRARAKPKSKQSNKSGFPDTLPCPKCGATMTHVAGRIYRCPDPKCEMSMGHPAKDNELIAARTSGSRPRGDIAMPDDSRYPREAPCPRCGRPAKLLVHTGGMYECPNPACNEFGDEFSLFQFRPKLE